MNDFIGAKKYLTISAFAKLSGISRKNLIYYDEIGILKPALVKENGYRYYSDNQIEEVSIILALKDLDIPLKEIKSYIENVSPDNLINLIAAQREKILDELNRLNQMNYIIEQRISNAPMISSIDSSKVLLEYCEEELLFLGFEHLYDENNIDDDFIKFLDHCKNEKVLYGYPLGVCTDYDSVLSDNIRTYKYFYKVSKDIDLTEKAIKPAGLYVINYDNSYLADETKSFDKVKRFIEENNLCVCGNVYIENMSDEIFTKNSDKYFSKISVQVKETL